jgi:ribonuclease R
VFRLGDHLRVRLINVVIDERKIDFELADSRAEPRVVRGPWQRRRGKR